MGGVFAPVLRKIRELISIHAYTSWKSMINDAQNTNSGLTIDAFLVHDQDFQRVIPTYPAASSKYAYYFLKMVVK